MQGGERRRTPYTLFECGRWRELREEEMTNEREEPLTAETLVAEVLRSEESWRKITRTVEAIVRQKEEIERDRQKQEKEGAHLNRTVRNMDINPANDRTNG